MDEKKEIEEENCHVEEQNEFFSCLSQIPQCPLLPEAESEIQKHTLTHT